MKNENKGKNVKQTLKSLLPIALFVLLLIALTLVFLPEIKKLATPEESLANGTSDRIIVSEGVINYKDGSYYYGDQESWKPGTGTAFDLKFSVDEKKLKDVKLSEDGYSLDAKVGAADLKELIGTDLNAVGDSAVTVSTNGVNLTGITVSCSTANGDIVIRTSYTYNPQDLFPEAEEVE